MSWTACPDPELGDVASVDAIETPIVPRSVDLGEQVVVRARDEARFMPEELHR